MSSVSNINDCHTSFAKVTRKVKLTNIRGLHARASAKFVTCAEQFDAVVEVLAHNENSFDKVVADSIMELLMLGAACGHEITISAHGFDAEPAVEALVALVTDNFGEES